MDDKDDDGWAYDVPGLESWNKKWRDSENEWEKVHQKIRMKEIQKKIVTMIMVMIVFNWIGIHVFSLMDLEDDQHDDKFTISKDKVTSLIDTFSSSSQLLSWLR